MVRPKAGLTMVSPAKNPSPDPSAKRWKLVSCNVNTANTRYDDVLRFLEREDAEVIFLMEVNEAWMAALRPLEARYPFRLAVPREDNFGIAIFSKLPFQGGEQAFGHYALPSADLTLPEQNVRLVAVHTLPPSGAENSRMRNEQLRELAEAVRGGPRVVLCGDLNLTPYSPWFGEFLKSSGLHSSAPPVSPTWLRHHPLFAIPIDHVLTGRDLAVAQRRVGPSLGSDHNPLVVEIAEAKK